MTSQETMRRRPSWTLAKRTRRLPAALSASVHLVHMDDKGVAISRIGVVTWRSSCSARAALTCLVRTRDPDFILRCRWVLLCWGDFGKLERSEVVGEGEEGWF